MNTCEYTKPHPSHHWWIDEPELSHSQSYRTCEGIKGTGFGDRSYARNFTKQELGEFEIWEKAVEEFNGEYHLHFMFNARGRWEWVLRESKSPLCGTLRCRRVVITPVGVTT